MTSFTIKNSTKETRLFKTRLIVAIVFVIIFTVILIGRLLYLQEFRYQHFITLSENNEIGLKPIAPRRGVIYDRNGVIVARNIPVFSLMVIPSKVADLEKMLVNINKIIPLNKDEIDQFYNQLKQHRRFEEIMLKLKLTNEDVARFSVDRYQFPGVSIKAQLIRDYPLSNALAHVIGYVGRINEQELAQIDQTDYAGTNFIGKNGIEKHYEAELHGTVGYRKVEMDASSREIRTISELPPVCGNDLYLTIDSHLQIQAERAFGHNRGALVMIQPRTGEILAFVSQPTYNPGLFVNGINQKDYIALQKDSSHPLYNRILSGLYAPGSTIKPFIALGGLNFGVVTQKFKIFDPGWYKIPSAKHIYYDWLLKGHGWVNVTKAIIHSCDTYFYDLAYKLGIRRIDTILDQFGFGQRTGIEMTEELEGNLPTPEWKFENRGERWYIGDTIVVGIGQGYLQVTPLQLAMATAILANRGIGFTPHLLRTFRSPKGEMVDIEPVLRPSILLKNSKYWDIVIDAMRRVVSEGTGRRFGKTNYSIAAKTGTAQIVNIKHDDLNKERLLPERFRNNSVFIAFAPINDPEIVIAVIVENNVEAPHVARQVLDYYFSKNKKKRKNYELHR